ncbi:14211_t:CDS:2, partial [Dentiscutata erythropus]
VTGPNSFCWCDKYLKDAEDKCEMCEERVQKREAVSIVPLDEIWDVRCNIVLGRTKIPKENQYKPCQGSETYQAASVLNILATPEIFEGGNKAYVRE